MGGEQRGIQGNGWTHCKPELEFYRLQCLILFPKTGFIICSKEFTNKNATRETTEKEKKGDAKLNRERTLSYLCFYLIAAQHWQNLISM